MLFNQNAIESGGYLISNSLRFQRTSSQYLSRTPASDGNRTTWTFSAWIKRGNLSYSTAQIFNGRDSGNDRNIIYFESNDVLVFQQLVGGAQQYNLSTPAVFRDPSAWYHLVVAYDSTQATSTNRVKIYINGVQQTLSGSYPSLNYAGYINSTNTHTLGKLVSEYYDGYMTEINFVNAQALTPSSFGQTDVLTGSWVASPYTGTYGTNGFYLKFANGTSTTTLGTDSSGNGNNWTLNNFTRSAGVSDCWMYDVPSGNGSPSATQPSSNYAVMNPLQKGSNVTLSAANLTFSNSTSDAQCLGTIGMSSGKWYWEFTATSTNGDCGIAKANSSLTIATGGDANSWGYLASTGNKYTNGSSSAYGATYTTNDVIGLAFDADAGTLTYYKNNVSQGTAFTGLTSGPYFPALGNNGCNGGINFGQRSFAYTPPSGFKALCTANLPAATIAKGNQYMDATLYTGDGTTNRAVVNAAGFAPDFVWVKSRSSAASHLLVDAVRGASAVVYSNSTIAEQTINPIASLNSNGFSVNQPNTGSDSSNINAVTYVGWQWKAGSSTVTNTSGSISSQVRANTTTGFSIVTFTGTGANATVGHGLGVAPAMIIFKKRNTAVTPGSDWATYHVSLGATRAIHLNLTSTPNTNSVFFNNTAPTSSVFSVGSANDTNISGGTYVAYCFAEIAGFSRFGSYTGNGSTDGVFVYLGFRPKYIMIKNSSAVTDWIVYDTSRSPYNVVDTALNPNTSTADGVTSAYNIDLVSNGFKCRSSNASLNSNGATFIFMAFAENPFNISNAR